MTVATILQAKGRNVVTAASTTSLTEIVNMLATRKIGAIVVCEENGDVRGIISERDIVRAIGINGVEVLNHAVSEHMTSDVMTCTSADTIDHCMAMMTTGRFRHLPVIEDGKLVGLVSIGDIVKERIAMAEREAEEMRSYISSS